MDERKQVQGMVRDFIHIKVPTTDAEKISSRNFHYDAGFTLAPGRYRMRFLVREGQSAVWGRSTRVSSIPDLAADSMTLKTSSVVWSSQRELLKAAVGQAEQITKKNAAANPLITGDEKVVPNVGDYKVFRRGQNMYIDFDVYDAAPDPKNSGSRDVKVQMSLFNQERRQDVRSGTGERHAARQHAARRRPGAHPGAPEEYRPRPLRLPVECDRRSRPQVRLPPRRGGDSIVLIHRGDAETQRNTKTEGPAD